MATDLLFGFAAVSLASAALGALLEYCAHAIHMGHRRR